MRPRTGVEKRLVAESFAPLPKSTVEWAKSSLFRPYGLMYVRGRGKKKEHVLWCLECGHMETVAGDVFDETRDELKVAGWVCPSCRELLKVEAGSPNQTRVEVFARFLALEPRGEWQVFRCFDIVKSRQTGGVLRYSTHERFRTFVNAKGVEYIVSRPYSRGWNYFRWAESGWMIGRHNGGATGYYVMEDVYGLQGIAIAPDGILLPELCRSGLCIPYLKTARHDPAQVIRCVMKYPQAETLLKSGHELLLADVIKNGKRSRVLKYWPSVKIALRHGYGHNLTLNALHTWLDYLEGLEREGKDMRSPRWLCPADLMAEHDRQIEREAARRRAEVRKNEELLLKDDSEENRKLLRHIAPIMDVVITDGSISISPLQSVRDFYEEGEALHHCVFSNKYYAKESSIILSAMVDGKRTETIEVDADTFTIEQCRAAHNGESEWHKSILELANANMDKFKSLYKSNLQKSC